MDVQVSMLLQAISNINLLEIVMWLREKNCVLTILLYETNIKNLYYLI